ncbi:receptor-type protein kinase, putative [Bodo saltans]|uniref:Receptor-type protein kinase, putative n=1 Tax=Bodo saltans TaxID=75058 RepID=A0A0S4JJY1_BODSA|nr:receptor-type protein kinase, putative [Bodo saltans]|eukprot:CUG90872.1 receptor-type protein kinase, putative [Bodo saltans]
MDGLANVVNSLTRLEYLDLNLCRRIFTIGYSKIASLTHLQCLDLGGSSYVTDDVVNCLSSSLTQLVRLDVSKSSITDIGLASISSMVRLVHLSLLFCDRITDTGIATLSSLIHMVNLKLGAAPSAARITATGVVAAVASMLQLQCLNVSGIRSVGLMLPTIADLHQLQVLDVSMCSSISYDSFVGISKLPDLKLLKRVGCDFEHDCVELLELMKRRGVILL